MNQHAKAWPQHKREAEFVSRGLHRPFQEQINLDQYLYLYL